MSQFAVSKIFSVFCFLLAACGSNHYQPGAVPSNVNLPEDASIGQITGRNAYPNLGFDFPLLVRGIPGEERILVVEQGGGVWAFADDEAVNEKRQVLDISPRVLFAGEQGLLGFTFDPEFARNRLVYLHYSMSDPRRNVISSMLWDIEDDKLDAESEKVLIEIEQPYSNHNGGSIEFGPDGYLYIGIGDGGRGGDPHNYAQNPNSLLGKLLRLDVHPENPAVGYAIPPDNPFVNQPGTRPEIFALGLRNPFRFSFDRETGDLWLGDVGQSTVEEIDIIEVGGNYGWRVLEGSQPYDSDDNNLPLSAFIPPVFEYIRQQGVSVTGGYIYRGSELAGLTGRYIYADYGSSSIWALSWDGQNVTANTRLASVAGPAGFGETNEGELLIASHSGSIYKLLRN